MNLGDPELELIDPTPNIYSLFIQFDNLFFWTKLASRAVVRWSKRMYSCAGVCSYEGRGGLCDIALSEPLLKLRPRKDLIETLLHEMIHAFLFVTCRDQDRDGHGPNFKAHMHRINARAGLNISIYHDFHDEVKLYQTHWWRCNGPCITRRPHFGIVRRTANRAPGPSDRWWECHKRNCGGTFIKIKEPEKPAKKTAAPKPKADITKYISTQKTINNNVPTNVPPKSVLKDSNNIPIRTKSNGASTVVITKKGPIFNPQVANKPPDLFSGKGHLIDGGRQRSNSVGVLEKVRNVWANKVLPESPTAVLNNKQNVIKSKPLNTTININNSSKANKHKADFPINSPPSKIKKIDDYFKNTASTMLKDLYGKDFQVTQPGNGKKLVAVDKSLTEIDKNTVIKTVEPKISGINSATSVNGILVDCPVCNSKISSSEINRHLDECLNKEVIDTLTKDNQIQLPKPTSSSKTDKKILKEIVGVLPPIPVFKGKHENPIVATQNIFNPCSKDLSELRKEFNTEIIKLEKEIKQEFEESNVFDSNDVNTVKEIVQKINQDKLIRESNNYVVLKEERPNNVNAKIKIEPGTSRDNHLEIVEQQCACCGNKINKPIEEHLDECLAFFGNNTTIPEGGASTSFANETIVIDDDDDDIFDETLTMNATGTKTPCPCCLKMIEEADMNTHLDQCLS